MSQREHPQQRTRHHVQQHQQAPRRSSGPPFPPTTMPATPTSTIELVLRCASQWDSKDRNENGRARLFDHLRQLRNTTVLFQRSIEEAVLWIVRDCVRGRLPDSQAAICLRDIFYEFEVEPAPPSLDCTDTRFIPGVITDVIWQLDVRGEDLESASISEEARRLVSLGKSIMSLRFLSHALIKERLEPEYLEAIGLVSSHIAFKRKAVRVNTSILYKQQKFNLLREESEGFAMLETYIASNLLSSVDVYLQTYQGRKTELDIYAIRREHLKDRVEFVLHVMSSLIGYFDLSPSKVLDILLDIFIANVADNWEFFIKVLEGGPWRPKPVTRRLKRGLEELEVREIEGNHVISQILGFKFCFYNRVVPSHQSTPTQLFWVAALLIKHKLVRLEEVYPHLSPSDDGVTEEFEEYLAKISESLKTAGRFSDSKLAEAGVLGDDGRYSSRSSDTGQPDRTAPSTNASVKPSRRSNQKAILAAHLIAIGDIKNARLILDRNPSLCNMYPEIADNMCRCLHIIVEPLYAALRPTRTFAKKKPSSAQFVPSTSLNAKLCQTFERIIVGRRINPPRYRFFYEHWTETLPKCEDYDTLLKPLRTLLTYVGAHLNRDVLLLGKIIRIGRAHLETSADTKIRNNWLSTIAQFLLPAMSLADHNPGLANELWSLLRLFPYDRRYALYGEWKSKTYDAVPELRYAKACCVRDSKYIMRRLSKETTKQYGRYIGKVVHSNPVIAFTVILEQLQAYDNQIPFVVDASRYLTELSFDVFAYVLVESLSTGKDRLQQGGIGVRPWLRNLATFSGNLFRKHPIELPGLLQYMFCQLASGNTLDLVVLQELLGQMTGVKPLDEATDAQLEAMAGGETLRRESLFPDTARVARKGIQRIVKPLVDSDLALSTALILGQLRKESLFANDATELKVIGWMQDNVQRSLIQYIDFLSTNLEKELYASLIPDVDQLCIQYRLDPPVAFHLLRPKLYWLMKMHDEEQAKKRDSNDSSDGREDMKRATSDFASGVTSVEDPTKSGIWHPGLHQSIKAAVAVAPPSLWKTIPPHFYVTFWQLSLYDIFTPHSRYGAEIARQRTIIQNLESERGDSGQNAATRRKKEKDRALLMVQQLERELKLQIENSKRVNERLKKEKDAWLCPAEPCEMKSYRRDVTDVFMQYCVFPRCLYSPSDALFVAKFILLLHTVGTQNFSTISLYDKIFDRNILQSMAFVCTEVEANNYGRFVSEILSTLTSWHKSKDRYKAEAIGDGLPGFALRWSPSVNGRTLETDLLSYEEFCTAIYKWHVKILKAVILCLESTEFVQIRNAIIVLNKLKDHYPVMIQHGIQLEAAIKKLIENETRQDLKLLSLAYSSSLKNMSASWISIDQFKMGRDPSIPTIDKSGEPNVPTQSGVAESKSAINLPPKPSLPLGTNSREERKPFRGEDVSRAPDVKQEDGAQRSASNVSNGATRTNPAKDATARITEDEQPRSRPTVKEEKPKSQTDKKDSMQESGDQSSVGIKRDGKAAVTDERRESTRDTGAMPSSSPQQREVRHDPSTNDRRKGVRDEGKERRSEETTKAEPQRDNDIETKKNSKQSDATAADPLAVLRESAAASRSSRRDGGDSTTSLPVSDRERGQFNESHENHDNDSQAVKFRGDEANSKDSVLKTQGVTRKTNDPRSPDNDRRSEKNNRVDEPKHQRTDSAAKPRQVHELPEAPRRSGQGGATPRSSDNGSSRNPDSNANRPVSISDAPKEQEPSRQGIMDRLGRASLPENFPSPKISEVKPSTSSVLINREDQRDREKERERDRTRDREKRPDVGEEKRDSDKRSADTDRDRDRNGKDREKERRERRRGIDKEFAEEDRHRKRERELGSTEREAKRSKQSETNEQAKDKPDKDTSDSTSRKRSVEDDYSRRSLEQALSSAARNSIPNSGTPALSEGTSKRIKLNRSLSSHQEVMAADPPSNHSPSRGSSGSGSIGGTATGTGGPVTSSVLNSRSVANGSSNSRGESSPGVPPTVVEKDRRDRGEHRERERDGRDRDRTDRERERERDRDRERERERDRERSSQGPSNTSASTIAGTRDRERERDRDRGSGGGGGGMVSGRDSRDRHRR